MDQVSELPKPNKRFFLSHGTSKTALGIPLFVQALSETWPPAGHWIATHQSTAFLIAGIVHVIVAHFASGGFRYVPKKSPQA